VAAAAARNPTIGGSLIGTNDYGLNAQTAAQFGTMYGALLDEWHSQMPTIGFIGMSPLARTTETANPSGGTLGDYRTAMQTAFSSRVWATFVDGSGVITNTATQTADGLHPNPTGTALVEAAWLAALP
jgi:lysophospholipase L1-like esterase